MRVTVANVTHPIRYSVLLLLTSLAGSADAQIYSLYECVEIAPRLAGTPLEGYKRLDWNRTISEFNLDTSLDTSHLHFSYLNNGPQQDRPRGPVARNSLNPGPLAVILQPTTFLEGYNQAAFSVPMNLKTPWQMVKWYLDQSISTGNVAPASIADTKGSDYCRVSLLPQYPVVEDSVQRRVKIATLVAPVPGPLTVETSGFTVRANSSLEGSNTSTGSYARYQNVGVVTNAVYEGGSIYADVTGALTPSRVNLIRLRVLSGNTVVAFGHVPVIVAPACPVAPSGSLPNATLGATYTVSLGATAGYDYALSGNLPPGLAVNGSTLSGTPTAAGTYPISLTVHSDNRNCYSQSNFNLTVNGQACAADVTSQVSYSFSGLTRNLATGLWSQTVTLQNRGATALPGPVTLVLTGLSPNATLTNAQGVTTCAAPSGQPYVQSGSTVGANQTISFPLTFTNSQANQSITYTVRVLAGGTQQ